MPSFRRRGGDLFFRYAGILTVMIAVLFAACGPASAVGAAVSGTQADGFGRIELVFDEETPVSAEARNGILVVRFGNKVTIGQERLAQQMPSFVSVLRRDPDGTGMRMALTQNFRVSVLEAGERVFIDLLPERWTGLPPGLPPEVVAELARRAREAEARFAGDRARRLAADVQSLPVRVAELPTLARMIFEPPVFAPITERSSANGLELRFDEPFELAPERPLSTVPGVRVVEEERVEGSLFVRIFLEDGYRARGFHEERNFVVDVAPVDPAPDVGGPEVIVALDPPPLPPQREGKPLDEGPAVEVELVRETPMVVEERVEVAPEPPDEAIAEAEVGTEGLRVVFDFGGTPPAAAFLHADVLRVVFDSGIPLSVAPFPPGSERYASLDAVEREGAFVTARMTLPSPELVRLFPEGEGWVLTIGDIAQSAAQPLAPVRDLDDSGRSVMRVPLAGASGVLWLDAPETGERIAVVTAAGDARNIAKLQRLVEFQLLPTAHGLAIVAQADDLLVRTEIDDVVIGRGAGLTMSLPDAEAAAAAKALPEDPLIDRAEWDDMRRGVVRDRQRELIRAVLEAPPSGRMAARFDLARFLVANELAAEAAAVLDFVRNEDAAAEEDPHFVLLRAIAMTALGRFAEARAMLSDPALEQDPEAVLWRAHLAALEGRWQVALQDFRRSRMMLDAYPDDLQGRMRASAVQAALELGEFPFAERELAMIGLLAPGSVSRDAVDLLAARLDAGLGRPEAALASFERVAREGARPYAAEATWRAVDLALKSNAIGLDDAIGRLETLAVSWRGDHAEIESIGLLGRLYAEQGRWREAFLATRNANLHFPDHPITLTLHEETARIFDEIFLGDLAAKMSRIDAVALFFDFRDFLPIGRRGDEIVRRLSDRLVELDLLDKAAELLRHQIDNRLNGAARSTVAARLATVYLMENMPLEALEVLRETRLPELPVAIKRARMLLEARALSDLSRTDLALEVLDGETGPEVDRLRADIYWTGRRWREAGEAHEQLLGTRWQDEEPLTERERTDVLRAAIAYSLGSEAIGLDRLRAKFIDQMANSEDSRVFALATTPDVSSTQAFRDIAKRATSADTLADFLDAYRERYPDAALSARPRAPALRDRIVPGAEVGAPPDDAAGEDAAGDNELSARAPGTGAG